MITLSINDSIKSTRNRMVKCPCCKHGRLCDVSGVANNIPVKVGNDMRSAIIIKCQKCGRSIGISIT